MLRLSDLTQRRLAIFVVDADSGAPRSRVPVYAEAFLFAVDAAQPLDDPYESESLDELAAKDKALAQAVEIELRRQIAESWARSNPDALEHVTGYVVHEVDMYIGKDPLPPEVGLLIRNAIRVQVMERNIPAPPASSASADRLIPLGLLATDHAGFASWDLERIAFRDLVPTASLDTTAIDFRVYPNLLESEQRKVLAQNRIAPDAIVCRIELTDG